VLKTVAFWDSSALIPLCVSQPQTAKARLLYERYGIVAWWATLVEMMSGLTRLERMGQITHDRFLIGKAIAREIVRGWIPVGSNKRIAADACSLLELYPLRAADALQLAAALEWCEGKPKGKVFLTFDQRLREAAGLAGFTLE
jgi:predicted nucleic acid-binding protein